MANTSIFTFEPSFKKIYEYMDRIWMSNMSDNAI